MAEFVALLRWLWIERGDTVAAVLFVLAFCTMAIVALRKEDEENA